MTLQPTGTARAEVAADTLVALLATLREFWPDSQIDVESSRRRAGSPGGGDLVFGVAPGFASPKLLVPLRSGPQTGLRTGRAAARALLRFSTDSTPRDAATRLAAAGAAGIGGSLALPDRIIVRDPGSDSLAHHLAARLGQRVSFSVGVGSARVNRKPVLQLFGDHGQVLGFAKVGDSPVSRADVAAEAEALRLVGSRELRHLQVPTVLHETTWRGLSVLVISALQAGPGQAFRDPWAAPVAAMAELSRTFGEQACALDDLPWWLQQRAAAGRLSDPGVALRAESCLDALESRSSGWEWRIGAWHGDWTPWNMAASRRGVRLWDFERFETGVPLGLDQVHYAVNMHTHTHGTSRATIQAGLGPTGRSSRALAADVYLVAITMRYLALAETSRGEHIAARAHSMLDVLSERLGLRRSGRLTVGAGAPRGRPPRRSDAP